MADSTTLKELIKSQLHELQNDHPMAYPFRQGNALYVNGQSQVLSQSAERFDLEVNDQHDDYKLTLEVNGEVEGHCNCKSPDWCHHKIAGLLQLSETLT